MFFTWAIPGLFLIQLCNGLKEEHSCAVGYVYLDIFWPELVLAVHVDVNEVLLPDRPRHRVELGVELRDQG